jgi:hypothetical protein
MAHDIFWYKYRIVQIIDKDNMLGDPNMHGKISWLSGWDTTGYVDDDHTPLIKVKLAGTRQYESAFGTRTVEVYQYISTISP